MKKSFIMMALALMGCVMGMSSCKSPKIAAYYTFETECVNDQMDGSVVVRAWGTGGTKSDAMRDAQKQAVYDVIFKGIYKGANLKPLLFEVNAKEKYEEYFDVFFNKKGEYRKYISMDATKMDSGERYKGKTRDSYAVVVRVLRKDLERKLIEDNILKK